MKNKLLILSLFLTNCAQNQHQQAFIITGFETYYNTFVQNTGIGTNDLVIQLGDPALIDPNVPDIVGLCQWFSNATPIVTIDSNYWSTASEDWRQELVSHELGHCILGRVHRYDFLSNGAPASIMYPNLFNPWYIDQNPGYYYNELVENRGN